ncbi:hypothetical protein FPOA_09207 [Fusarium poae]|uniref:Uncharacterized protein n=1 Tax=Fusarium poae TaxID=36050 RepID=A0A1B8ARA0_FUSPO|nr:hypothetical protein FPOA_09207 [Fusarium poae]
MSSSGGTNHHRKRKSASRPAESTASTGSDLSQSEILSRALRSASGSIPRPSTEGDSSTSESSSTSLPPHLHQADLLARLSRSHRSQVPRSNPHRPSTRSSRDHLEPIKAEQTSQTNQYQSETTETSGASTEPHFAAEGAPVPPSGGSSNLRDQAKYEPPSIQEDPLQDEDFPIDQKEASTTNTDPGLAIEGAPMPPSGGSSNLRDQAKYEPPSIQEDPLQDEDFPIDQKEASTRKTDPGLAAEGTPVPLSGGLFNMRDQVKSELPSIQEEPLQDEDSPIDQNEAGRPKTNLLTANKESIREMWHGFCGTWSLVLKLIPYRIVAKPKRIGVLLCLASVCYIISSVFSRITGLFCESPAFIAVASITGKQRNFCIKAQPQHQLLRNLTDCTLDELTFIESNISSVHVWLNHSIQKLESDLRSHSEADLHLERASKYMTASAPKFVKELDNSLKAERIFIPFHRQLSIDLDRFITRFPKMKPDPPWLWIPFTSSASHEDATYTTKDLLDIFADVQSNMKAMSKNYTDPSLFDRKTRLKVCEAIYESVVKGSEQADVLHAACTVWDQGTKTIGSVAGGRRGMLRKDREWIDKMMGNLEARLEEIKKEGRIKRRQREEELETMVAKNYALAIEMAKRLREYSKQHYW